MHTFLQDSPDNFSVGYWAPAKALTYEGGPEPTGNYSGEWIPLRDCKTAGEAAAWVSYLNGGKFPNAYAPW